MTYTMVISKFTFNKIRTSRPEVFCKKGVLRNFTKFTGKHLCQSLLPEACNFIKKETLPQVFSCEFCKISKNTFFYRTPLEAASAKSWYSEHCLYRFFEYITLSFKLFGAQQRYYEKAVITCQYPNVI